LPEGPRFIRGILAMNQKHRQTSHIALWVPILWFVISSIRGYVYPGPEDPTYVEGHPYTITFVVLMILGGLILYARRSALSAFMKENKLILLLYCVIGLSILWSYYPWISLKRWVKTIGSLEMVLIMLTEPDPLASFSFVVRRFFYIVIPSSLVLIFFFPSLGQRVYPEGGASWVGLFINRNSFARTAMIFSIYFAWSLTRKKNERSLFLDSLFLLLSLIALVGSGSRTSTLGFSVGVGTFFFVLYLKRKISVQDIGMTLGYSLVTGIILLILVEQLFLRESFASWFVDALGRDLTFTGRTALWSDLWKVGISSPFLGHGFGGFWNLGNPVLVDFWKEHTWLPMTAHDGYLAVFLETGLLGLATVLLVILNTYRKVSRSFVADFEFARFRMAMLLVLILHNFSETSFCNLNDPLWVVFLFISVPWESAFRSPRKSFKLVPAESEVGPTSNRLKAAMSQ
jgi:exopolysaccharide production protein ExoQ